jgi:ferredoxin
MNSKVLTKIAVHPERCKTCGICMLQCSFAKEKKFSPSDSRIIVGWEGYEPSINFREDCDECGICARFCVYGTLELIGR